MVQIKESMIEMVATKLRYDAIEVAIAFALCMFITLLLRATHLSEDIDKEVRSTAGALYLLFVIISIALAFIFTLHYADALICPRFMALDYIRTHWAR